MTINELVKLSHESAIKRGFWDKPREFGTLLALIHSELSEALEADRCGRREQIAEELADVIIRVCDLCGSLEIDLESAIHDKLAKNTARPYLHGKLY